MRPALGPASPERARITAVRPGVQLARAPRRSHVPLASTGCSPRPLTSSPVRPPPSTNNRPASHARPTLLEDDGGGGGLLRRRRARVPRRAQRRVDITRRLARDARAAAAHAAVLPRGRRLLRAPRLAQATARTRRYARLKASSIYRSPVFRSVSNRLLSHPRERCTATKKLGIVTLGTSGRRSLATPADFPLQDSSPYRGLHVRRESLGLVPRSMTLFCRQILTSRFATF
jgi:hypothetical protein